MGAGAAEVVGEEGDDGVSDGAGAKRGDVRGVEIPLKGVGEEGDDGVSDRTGAKRGDVRGVEMPLRGVGLVNKLMEG